MPKIQYRRTTHFINNENYKKITTGNARDRKTDDDGSRYTMVRRHNGVDLDAPNSMDKNGSLRWCDKAWFYGHPYINGVLHPSKIIYNVYIPKTVKYHMFDKTWIDCYHLIPHSYVGPAQITVTKYETPRFVPPYIAHGTKISHEAYTEWRDQRDAETASITKNAAKCD